MTVSEAALWNRIRRRQTGARFRRQVPIGVWIADFASLGFTVIRFTNEWIAKELPSAVQTIRDYVEDLQTHRPLHPLRGAAQRAVAARVVFRSARAVVTET